MTEGPVISFDPASSDRDRTALHVRGADDAAKTVFETIAVIRREQLKPGDVIVASTEAKATEQGALRIYETLQRNFPEQKIFILEGGLELSIKGVE